MESQEVKPWYRKAATLGPLSKASQTASYGTPRRQKPGVKKRITTMKGLTFCAEPNKPWVIKAMKLVDGRKMAYTTTARPMSTASERTVNTQGGS
ncbi:hypothetical protein C0J50_23345 [Silurus asotus]|uniref:Uncharacterized protein n=1 Tax=Silurus asotus TaxID=30991 RepID=A0AAD5AKC9_SILAS|nr:hypothetical protein C0J50_23345 [Silurus asotus]